MNFFGMRGNLNLGENFFQHLLHSTYFYCCQKDLARQKINQYSSLFGFAILSHFCDNQNNKKMSSVFFFNYTFFCYCTALAVTCGWYCVFILFLFWCDRPRTSLLSRCTWPRWECTTSWRTMSSRQVVLLLLVFSKHMGETTKWIPVLGLPFLVSIWLNEAWLWPW